MRSGFLIAGGAAVVLLAGMAVSGIVGLGSAGGAPLNGGDLLEWIVAKQRAFHRELTGLLASLKADHRNEVVFGLLVSSFAYGIFHAAGPGHGKAVLTTYLFSTGASIRRSLGLATAASFLQGLVALALVYGLVVLGGLLPRDSQAAAVWAERVSFALVALVGVYLFVRAGERLYRRLRGEQGQSSCGHEHGHDHAACGRAHFPSPGSAERATDLKAAVGLVLSIGLRPCSGAVIVLIFAQAFGIAWAGVGAVVAMSVGTAVTVAVLALLAVGARGFALSVVDSGGTGRIGVATEILALVGGLAILALGIALVSTSYELRHPLGL